MELETAIEKEKIWQQWLQKQDKGSYCEAPSAAYELGKNVLKSYQSLVDSLIQFQRSGVKGPENV